MAPLVEVVGKVLEECGLAHTGVGTYDHCVDSSYTSQAGMVADVEAAAKVAGVRFTTLHETAGELARQFGLAVDEEPAAAPSAQEKRANSWDEWAQRMVETNTAQSVFSEDDIMARQLMMQQLAPPT